MPRWGNRLSNRGELSGSMHSHVRGQADFVKIVDYS